MDTRPGWLVFSATVAAGCLVSSCLSTSGYEDAVTPRRASERAAGEGEHAPPAEAQRGSSARAAVVSNGAKVTTGPLEISVEDAILLTLENNRGFSVQRLGPAKRATYEDEAAAAFDPALSASFSAGRADDSLGTGSTVDTESGSAGISSLHPSGTQVGLELGYGRTDPGPAGATDTARVGLGVTQPLMRGASRSANLASIRQAALDTRSSEYELRGFAESLVADVEKAYWDCALAERQTHIYEESLRLAEKQLDETRERIDVGRLARMELSAARAEVAARRDALVGVRGELATRRIRLLRLMNPPTGASGAGGLWEREVILKDLPSVPEADLGPTDEHVRHALRSRPDLNQARLALRRGELEVARTRNGLLPKLDLFVNLGRTGYADSFGGAVGDLDGDGYDVSGGLTLEWAIGNRAARGRHRRAVLSREEAGLALENMEQLVQVDVRTAHIAATTAREEIAAKAATRALKEETLRAETEKFRVGKSTTFQVAQAQGDLVASRISEIQAVVGYLEALVELCRLDGSLLERRGIAAPGLPQR